MNEEDLNHKPQNRESFPRSLYLGLDPSQYQSFSINSALEGNQIRQQTEQTGLISARNRVCAFLKQHSSYDVLPVSYRIIVLDTSLLVKKALAALMQNGVVSAPLWDSTNQKFAGMLTVSDFINLIQYYYKHSSYSVALEEIEQFQIQQLRDVESRLGSPSPQLMSIHPLKSLYEACKLLVEAHAHRLPLVDEDSETGQETIVSVLTQYRILKFIAMNCKETKDLRKPLSEIKIGVYENIATAKMSTPVIEVVNLFAERRISSVPIVDDNGTVLNVYETMLVRAGAYDGMDLPVGEAMLRRTEDFPGVHTCTLNDCLNSMFDLIRKAPVHRLIVVDSENKLKGIVSLSDIMRTIALLPVDIFLVSSTTNPDTGLKHSWATKEQVDSIVGELKFVYYGMYGLIAVFCAVLIPFAYFYFEELEEDETSQQRFLGALKYTAFFIAFIFTCLIFGILIQPQEKTPIDLDFFRKLLTGSMGERSISFVMAVLMIVGMAVSITYTAPGLSLLPIGMIKGTKQYDTLENAEIVNNLVLNREKQRIIRAKYQGSNNAMSRIDTKEMEKLQTEEKILVRQLRESEASRTGIWNKILYILRPFEFVGGIILLLLTVGIVLSVFLTCIDKIKNSVCGKDCGYIISHSEIFNPLNYIFVHLSKYFPVDYFFAVLLILYFFSSTVVGVVSIGIRFLWIHLYKIRRSATPPQALLFAAMVLMMSLLALNYTLTMVVAPQYAQFGSQKYCNHTVGEVRDCHDYPQLIIPCDVTAPTDICTPTITSTFLHRIMMNTPFFGVVFYYAQWAFLAVVGVGIIWSLIRSPGRAYDDGALEEEEEGLLNSSRNRNNQQ
ncbi:7319_t:CDS:10 [Acaulospora morrowiae]|uniref:7319_t:CDS:1 n=1 Tax=Acaulospora morrowiae TaxID=94023 RepID=A0A9N9HDW4_9GLOM|nr:7319_t:CDS:10 [Acaulospora morrowiae]